MINPDSLSIIILAAGKGTRMKSNTAKVLHEVFHVPMINHVIGAAQALAPKRIVVIIGHQRETVQETIKPLGVDCLIQEEQLGTGHAVLIAKQTIPEKQATVMILCGDTPLIRPETLQEMYRSHVNHTAALTVMTTILENPANYGRILSDRNGKVFGIVEEKDADPEQKRIQEINAGIYCVQSDLLFSTLRTIGTDNAQGEMYLTDIVKKTVASGYRVEKFVAPSSLEVLGVNSRIELAEAHRAMQLRHNRELLLQGVSMYSPETIAVSLDSHIGQDSLLMAGVQITGKSHIGRQCRIGQGAILHNCILAENVCIGPYCCLDNCTIAAGTTIPAHKVQL